MIQVLSVIGALGVLSAFVALQTKRVDPESTLYLALNLGGSLLLTVTAVVVFNVGIILLNVIWALVSLRALMAAYRRRHKHPERVTGLDL